MEKTVDRRVRKTKAQLKAGLTSLMKEKPVNEITVKELSDYVDINRGTFYLHYKDVFELLEAMEDEIIDEMCYFFDKYKTEELNGKPFPLLKDIFIFIGQNSELASVLLGPTGDLAFMDRIREIVKEKCLHTWMILFSTTNSIYYEYFYTFILDGIIGLIRVWLSSDKKETPTEMAEMTESFITEGTRIFSQ